MYIVKILLFYKSLYILKFINKYMYNTYTSFHPFPSKSNPTKYTRFKEPSISRVYNHIGSQMIEYILTFLSSSITINK